MQNSKTGRNTDIIKRGFVIAIWLLVWQLATSLVHNEILFVGPVQTLQALIRLAGTGAFWGAVFSSCGRILTGFLIGALVGALLAVLSFQSRAIQAFTAPFVHLCKTVPVACFVVILLIMAGTSYTALIVSGIVVLPVLYNGVYSGLKSSDKEELEIADMFTMTHTDRMKHIFLPALYPFLLSALKLACGVAFKAGIAAEVIAQTYGSLGNSLYKAKVLLQTDALFAITIVVVLLSLFTEKAVVFLFRKWGKHNEYE